MSSNVAATTFQLQSVTNYYDLSLDRYIRKEDFDIIKYVILGENYLQYMDSCCTYIKTQNTDVNTEADIMA